MLTHVRCIALFLLIACFAANTPPVTCSDAETITLELIDSDNALVQVNKAIAMRSPTIASCIEATTDTDAILIAHATPRIIELIFSNHDITDYQNYEQTLCQHLADGDLDAESLVRLALTADYLELNDVLAPTIAIIGRNPHRFWQRKKQSSESHDEIIELQGDTPIEPQDKAIAGAIPFTLKAQIAAFLTKQKSNNPIVLKNISYTLTLAFGHKKPIFITGGYTGIQVWNTKSYELVKSLDCNNLTTAIVIAPDDSHFASLGKNCLCLWDMQNYTKKTINLESNAHAIAFAPDSKIIAIETDTDEDAYTVAILNISNPENTIATLKHDYDVTSLSFTEDGNRLICLNHTSNASFKDGLHELVIWNTNNWEKIQTFGKDLFLPLYEKPQYSYPIVWLHKNGILTITSAIGNKIAVVNLAQNNSVEIIYTESPLGSKHIAVDATTKPLVATFLDNGTLNVWNARSQQQIARFSDRTNNSTEDNFTFDTYELIAFSPNSRILASQINSSSGIYIDVIAPSLENLLCDPIQVDAIIAETLT